jgi:ribosomal protection tetracycline resistance protein
LSRRTLNLGILAHVDAGKTTLTERLLYAAGVIDEIGSVDDGTTQTDFLALERQRGITIRAAVVSFAVGDVTVNLIDTPGHPDFIAEVERSLGVLDGAVLVLSAVEGVQPQTLLLMRALQRLQVPTLLFVNKIDRAGADGDRVLGAIEQRLTPAVVPMGLPGDAGRRDASFVPFGPLDEEAAAQSRLGRIHPVFFGSALTGAGVEALTAGIAELLPATEGDPDGPAAGRIFKIERGPSGEKIAYVRMFSGTVRVRDRLTQGKVTALAPFADGTASRRDAVSAGGIARLWGLGEARIGDSVGERVTRQEHRFAPPTLETVVVPREPDDRHRLRVALDQLAEQDPLIDVRQDDEREELSVSLYGEVQKEVIQATLAADFGVDVAFRETTTICVERPAGSGEAVEILHAETNPFAATIGLAVDPAPADSGVDFRLAVDPRTVPLYLYKTVEGFAEAIGRDVARTLQEGLHGWRVTDCIVTMTRCTYRVPDGPPSVRGPLSTVADFRRLTPLVLAQALERAGTMVCEPVVRARLEVPAATIGAVLAALARLGAAAGPPSLAGELAAIEAVLPAARAQVLRQELPALTGGEGVLETDFAGYEPVAGEPPTRRRTTPNPLKRAEYLMHLAHRV